MIEHIRGILAVFARNGLFDEGVELIGSWCFYLYQKHSEELRRLYDTLPKGWKKKITDSLAGAQKALPLLEKDISRLKVTLRIQ